VCVLTHTSEKVKEEACFLGSPPWKKYATKTNTSLVGLVRPLYYFSIFCMSRSPWSWFIMNQGYLFGTELDWKTMSGTF